MKLSLLGLGIIGTAWAKNLIADDMDIRCWNRTPKDFPHIVPSIEEAVQGAEFVIIVVADPAAVESILKQALPHLVTGQTIIQCSTISAEWTHRFAKQVRGTGADFLEAPFTGSRPAAEQRKTVFYTAGESEVLEKARPVLERLASSIQYIGPLGTASSLKLAMNIQIAGIAQALCESLALCRASGIDDEKFFDALHLNAARSGVSDLKEPKLLARDYSPQFSIKHMAKDLRLAQETTRGVNLELPQLASLIPVYQQALENGWSEDDYISLERLLGETP
ncbi:MAG: NAD(P)-dependent oxidoreductase [Candidatus Sumerlaeaceae bacterium]